MTENFKPRRVVTAFTARSHPPGESQGDRTGKYYSTTDCHLLNSPTAALANGSKQSMNGRHVVNFNYVTGELWHSKKVKVATRPAAHAAA